MHYKKILITGASRGLGLAIAQRLRNDYQLVLHASKPESFNCSIPNSEMLCADFSDPEQLQEFCKQLKKLHGEDLYGVINNAGLTFDNSILFQNEKAIDKMLQVNLKAPIMICKTAMKVFSVKKQGVIINLSSVVGETGNAFQSVYSATKAGLVAFSKSLAQEVAALDDEHQIRIMSVAPGFIETDMTRQIPDQEKEKYLKMIPSRRFGRAEEVASLIHFLLSPQSAYVNGTNIHINGGLA